MKIASYLENKIFYILFQISTIIVLSLFLEFIEIPLFYILLIIAIILLILICYLFIDYHFQKKKYLQITYLLIIISKRKNIYRLLI